MTDTPRRSGEIVADDMQRDATITRDGRFRYDLTRRWSDHGQVCWVMLNPSTADGFTDDPTIRRCIAFTKAWGYGSLVVVNLYAARTTDPKALLTMGDPIGPVNAEWVDSCIEESVLVVAAWGTFVERMDAKGYPRLAPEGSAQAHGVPIRCLGKTKAGHPRHPLYVKATAPLRFWPDEHFGGSAPTSGTGPT